MEIGRPAIWIAMIGIAACGPQQQGATRSDIEVDSRTTISGTVNGSAIEGTVVASFNTGRGGASRCEFAKLPADFTPSSIGTHT